MDASAYVAIARTADVHHEAALAALPQIRGARLMTSLAAVAEAYAVILYRVRAEAAQKFRTQIQAELRAGALEGHAFDEEALTESWAVTDAHPGVPLSLTDAHLIALVRRLANIDAIFTFDRHLALAGVPLIP
ncbi:MAG: type II toxin-antitoxin system VapC family toxin [Candidatus Dormibacteria bacterium]